MSPQQYIFVFRHNVESTSLTGAIRANGNATKGSVATCSIELVVIAVRAIPEVVTRIVDIARGQHRASSENDRNVPRMKGRMSVSNGLNRASNVSNMLGNVADMELVLVASLEGASIKGVRELTRVHVLVEFASVEHVVVPARVQAVVGAAQGRAQRKRKR